MKTGERLPQYGPELVAHLSKAVERTLELERKLAVVADLLTAREKTVRYQFSGNTDGSGNATLQVQVSVRAGEEFSLHRLIADDGTGTFSAPTANGSLEIRVNGQRIDGADLAAGSTIGGLPAVFTASSSAGIFVREGDVLEVAFVACGARSKKGFGVAQGKIRRVPLGE